MGACCSVTEPNWQAQEAIPMEPEPLLVTLETNNLLESLDGTYLATLYGIFHSDDELNADYSGSDIVVDRLIQIAPMSPVDVELPSSSSSSGFRQNPLSATPSKKVGMITAYRTVQLNEKIFVKVVDKYAQTKMSADICIAFFKTLDRGWKGNVNFRDFCRGISICLQGSYVQKVSFLVEMFSILYGGKQKNTDPISSKSSMQKNSENSKQATDGVSIRGGRQRGTNKLQEEELSKHAGPETFIGDIAINLELQDMATSSRGFVIQIQTLIQLVSFCKNCTDQEASASIQIVIQKCSSEKHTSWSVEEIISIFPQLVTKEELDSSLVKFCPMKEFSSKSTSNHLINSGTYSVLDTPRKKGIEEIVDDISISTTNMGQQIMPENTVDSAGDSSGTTTVSKLKFSSNRLMRRRTSLTDASRRERGIFNLGNTCYLGTALQCLSHSPLLDNFFLSGRFSRFVNKSNKLGYEGRFANEYAALVRELFTDKESTRMEKFVGRYVAPRRFLKLLQQTKTQFRGNYQQDAQEALGELLDCLHEDLRRQFLVEAEAQRDSSPTSVVAGVDSESEPSPSQKAWIQTMNLSGSSPISDLFRGQLQTESICKDCKRNSTAFDSFMSLSLPLPEAPPRVIALHFLRNTPLADGERYSPPSRHCVSIPRNSSIKDLIDALLKTHIKDGYKGPPIDPKQIHIMEVYNRKIVKQFAKENSIKSIEGLSALSVACDSDSDSEEVDDKEDNPDDINELTKARPSLHTLTLLAMEIEDKVCDTSDDESGDGHNGDEEETDQEVNVKKEETSVGDDNSFNNNIDCGSIARNEIIAAILKRLEGDGHSDTSSKIDTPMIHIDKTTSKKWFKVGDRVDAKDKRGNWYSASIVELVTIEEPIQRSQSDLCQGETGTPRKRSWSGGSFTVSPNTAAAIDSVLPAVSSTIQLEPGSYIRCSFDCKTAQYDRYYSTDDIQRGLLTNVYTHTRQRKSRGYIPAVHRIIDDDGSCRIVGTPFLVSFSGGESCSIMLEKIYRQGLRYTTQLSDFIVRMISFHDPLTTVDKNDHYEDNWINAPFPSDDWLPFINVTHSAFMVAIDWHDQPLELFRSTMSESFVHYKAQELRNTKNSKTLYDCLDIFTQSKSIEQYHCDGCHAKNGSSLSTVSFCILPDILCLHLKRFSMEGAYGEKVTANVSFPLNGLDLTKYICIGLHPGKSYVYDLYAVVNHSGILGGGHYTAYVRLCSTRKSGSAPCLKCLSSDEGVCQEHNSSEWVLCDDATIISVPTDQVTGPAAYVLFYKRRFLTHSNVANLGLF